MLAKADDTNCVWGSFTTNGLRCGLKPIRKGGDGNLDFVEIWIDTSSTNLVKVNLPTPRRLFAIELRDSQERSVSKTSLGLLQGQLLPNRVRAAGLEHDWRTIQRGFPRQVWTLRPKEFFIVKASGVYELRFNLTLYLFVGKRYFENIYLPPVEVKIALPAN